MTSSSSMASVPREFQKARRGENAPSPPLGMAVGKKADLREKGERGWVRTALFRLSIFLIPEELGWLEVSAGSCVGFLRTKLLGEGRLEEQRLLLHQL